MKIKYTQYFWSFVLVLASVRGAFVYHLGLSPNMIYTLTGILLICFGLLSFRYMLVNKGDKSLVLLRNAVVINYIFIGFYMLVSMFAISLNQYSLAYSFAVFPIIFTLIKYEDRLLNGIVYTIMLITVVGVVYFYNIGISGGFDAIEAANLTLRPGELRYSRIGENLLPAGYQGDHHDAANILVMCGVFILSKSMLTQELFIKYLDLSVYFLVVFAALLTGSTANFIVLVAVSSLTLLFYAKKHPYMMMLIVCCAIFAIPLLLDALSNFTYLYEKASYNQFELEGGGMFNSLDMKSILSSFHAILFGFGYVFKVPMINSEIAFVKALVMIGFIPFLVLMFICFSPLYYIHTFRKNIKSRARVLRYHNPSFSTANFINTNQAFQHRLIIAAMPVLAGTLTLLHYGSLFRVTSVGLFCVLIAIFFKEYLSLNKMREMQWPTQN